jgi:hypothetical protein
MENRWEKIENILKSPVDDLMNIIHSKDEYRNKINELKENFNNRFNIFRMFSDSYYKENLHSDIIKYILDPRTDRIGNEKYIEIFKNFIEDELRKKPLNADRKIELELDLNSIIVKREKDRIDLLIEDDTNNCIIIENKIYNAEDKDDQLGRYYNILSDRKPPDPVQAVIYLTLSPFKKLDEKKSIKNESLRKKIVEYKLIELPVVNKEGESNFLDNFLIKCIKEVPRDNEFATLFLEDYYNLLQYLGVDFMETELKTKAMYEIFNNEKTLEIFRIISSLNDPKIIGEVFKEYLKKNLKFEVHPDAPGYVIYKKTIMDDINIGFHSDLSFGFVNTPDKRINSENIKIFKQLFRNEELQKYFKEPDVLVSGDSANVTWVYKKIDYDKLDCLNDLKELVEKFEKIIENGT